MPGRKDIRKILVIGAGPIKIGQACEFDYSGTQACKALAEEGYEVILVNSNPATIMTDPQFATRTYVEPLQPAVVAEIIRKDRPDALLPTMGGQTALNIAVELAQTGVLGQYAVELIGAGLDSIKLAEDRALFRNKMIEIGLPVPGSFIVHDLSELSTATEQLGLPIIVRPAFTLGGTGSGIAHSQEELVQICRAGLAASPVSEVLLEESVIGWKEIELEVVRDRVGNFIVICAIENIDPMGVHTGDSITVAPTQTLSDKEYQKLRNAAKQVIDAIGISCGGSNIQFAMNPENDEYAVIEMNPRVSRSSALASKATGYPIAKIAAKLAVGLTLDEIRNDIAGGISACFEPVIDYVVTKIPRFNFDKFHGASTELGTEMKSVGEAMAIGATFQESAQKALRSLDLSLSGFSEISSRRSDDRDVWLERLRSPSRYRLTDIWGAFAHGLTPAEVAAETKMDPWFIDNLNELFAVQQEMVAELKELAEGKSRRTLLQYIERSLLVSLKRNAFSDRQIAAMLSLNLRGESVTEQDVFELRLTHDVMPSYKTIDTCAAEFESETRYLYSTYTTAGRDESEGTPKSTRKVVVLGSGPNRIGQGIEFDYCCVQASMTLKEIGVHSIMVNCNPETVSTDYDVSDTLYFEPVTLEDVSNIVLREKPDGIIIQFGGQTPLNLSKALEARGFNILGTACESTDIAEDRGRFGDLLTRLGLKQPPGSAVLTVDAALSMAAEIGYPVLIRPSFVLGGRAMQVVHSPAHLERLVNNIFEANPDAPVLINQFLTDAVELDVDAVCDGDTTVIAGIMEHVEKAGVHSGDSACVLPPQNLSHKVVEEVETATRTICSALQIVGLMNIQFAVKNGVVYVLEVNPRASRTVPFVSKATGIPWTKIATRVIMGESLSSLRHLWRNPSTHNVAVKSVCIPFNRFLGSVVGLGPEMRSTGEVMGLSNDLASAFAKAQIASDRALKGSGPVLISSSPALRQDGLAAVEAFEQLGMPLLLANEMQLTEYQNKRFSVLPVESFSVHELAERFKEKGIACVISLNAIDEIDKPEQLIRQAAVVAGLPVIMTLAEALLSARAVLAIRANKLSVKSLQESYVKPPVFARPYHVSTVTSGP